VSGGRLVGSIRLGDEVEVLVGRLKVVPRPQA
jgi:hypothetical protein